VHNGVAINRQWKRYSWLDLWKFSQSLLADGQQLIHTKYFTSRLKGKPESERRQNTYLDALGTLPNLSIFYGLFQSDPKLCSECGHASLPMQEKKTDVTIATQMIHDALQRNFDVAILVSADSDQVPTVEMVRKVFKRKVIVAFPPKRFSADLQRVATASFRIENGGAIMYYMIHATDHPEAPMLMSRAYRKTVMPLEPLEQLKLQLGLEQA
jgi:uncharacterized LabA/DUF88 family protein